MDQTYQLYNEENWYQLTEVGQEAVKNGLDYFYLRIRMGIAYFHLKNYRKAATHLEKALDFNGADASALEYLYFIGETNVSKVEEFEASVSSCSSLAAFHLSTFFLISLKEGEAWIKSPSQNRVRPSLFALPWESTSSGYIAKKDSKK